MTAPARGVVAVDVGGTFTDVLLVAGNGTGPVLAKVPSTADPAEGVVHAVEEAARRAGIAPDAVELVLNGTTVVTNTVIERRGARVGLLVTRGFRNILEIARSWTPGPVSGWMVWEKPPPLADTRDVRELSGRIDTAGNELEPLDEGEARAAIRELAQRGVEAITVALVNGYVRPDVEARIAAWAAEEAPDLPVSLASHVVPEIREYERTLAAVANAYVQPAMRSYVRTIQHDLARSFASAALDIVRSDGGVMSASDAVERPVETVLSGPAGGVRAAVHLGRTIGRPDVLSFDMGGTSTDVALSRDGQAALSRRSSLTDYYKIRTPSLDVVAIGAGGGSIARVPGTGALRVGPDSAGASPGPACYGHGGTEPTVTDADVVLGYLPSLLGARMALHADVAREAMSGVAERLGLSVDDAARAVVDVVNDRMLGGLRLVSVQRGHDPREFTLVAFGGAGPLHANALMELIGSPVAVVPPAPGVFSAQGFLVADVQREFARSHIQPLADVGNDALLGIVEDLSAKASAWLDVQGFAPEDQSLCFQFGMRYARQGYELPVLHDDPAGDEELENTLLARFLEAHQRTYSFTLDMEPELVVVRCVAAARQPPLPAVDAPPATGPVSDALRVADHRIYWDGAWVTAPIYRREAMQHGHAIDGPAIVEQEDSTTLVHPGTTARVDRHLNLLLERS
jgi:N-methylhydantoinase A